RAGCDRHKWRRDEGCLPGRLRRTADVVSKTQGSDNPFGIYRKTRHRDVAISNVSIDAIRPHLVAGTVRCHVPDNPISGQFRDDIVALSIGIRIGGVSYLKREPG